MIGESLDRKNQTFFKFFPPPNFLLMSAVGLNISDHSVKILELIHGPSTKIGRFGEEPIPHGIVESGNIDDKEGFKKVLREIKKKHNLSMVRVSLPEEKAYVFKLHIPNAKDNLQIRSNIEFQLENNVPISNEEAIFDHNVIPGSRKKDSLDVGVSVLPKKVVSSFLSLFLESGLQPLSFEIEAESIARSIIKEGDMGTYMIVDYGRTRTGFSVVSQGVVRYTSTANIGGEPMEEIIKKETNLSGKEAEDIKNTKGLVPNNKFPNLDKYLIDVASVLKEEINKRYIYWHTHQDKDGQTGEKIKKILLVGGNANLNGLDDYLASNLKADVQKADVWSNVNFEDGFVPPINSRVSLSYASAIGLSLREFI